MRAMRDSLQVVCFVIVAAVSLVFAGTTQGQTPGYRIKYSDVWPEATAVRYVKVTIEPLAGKSLEDKVFFAVCNASGWRSENIGYCQIGIRKGDTSATGEIYLPGGFNNVALHVETDGNLRRNQWDVAKEHVNSPFFTTGAWTGLSMLIASDQIKQDQVSIHKAYAGKASGRMPSKPLVAAKTLALDDVANVIAVAAGNAMATGLVGKVKLGAVNHPRVSGMRLENLPSRWYGYLGMGAVVLDRRELAKLEKSHPQKLEAIRRWVAHSGIVIVTYCGPDMDKASDALAFFGDPCVRQFEKGKVHIPTQKLERYSGGLRLGLPNSRKLTEFREWNNSDKHIMGVPLLNGTIICLSDEASDWDAKATGKRSYWQNVSNFASLRAERIGIINVDEYGNYPHAQVFPDYDGALAFPEFTTPPRFVFETVSIIYLILIGPVAWIILKRIKRLNLMYVIVPFVSATCCLAILGFAIFSEGFEKRVNRLVITELDQIHQRQRSRGTFHVYSGVQPGAYQVQGSNFAIQSVYRSQARYGVQFQYGWDEGNRTETVGGGDMKSRTNHQLNVFESSTTEMGLDIRFPTDGSAPLVNNRLGSRLDIAVIAMNSKASDGKVKTSRTHCWVVRDLGNGEGTQCQEMGISEIQKEMRINTDEQLRETAWNNPATGSNLPSAPGLSNHISFPEIVAEAQIVRYGIGRYLSSNDGSDGTKYVAIVDDCDFVDTPIEGATVSANLNIILGRAAR